MKRFSCIAFIAFLLTGCSEPTEWGRGIGERTKEAKRIESVILSADKVELIFLDPIPRIDSAGHLVPPPEDKAFEDWIIIDRGYTEKKELIKKLAASFRASIEESDGAIAMRFNPRHVLKIKNEGTDFKLIVCFECAQAKIEGYDPLSFVAIEPNFQNVWDEVFEEVGIKTK